MGFFDKIFGHKKAQTNTAKKTPIEPIQATVPKNENVIKLLHLKKYRLFDGRRAIYSEK